MEDAVGAFLGPTRFSLVRICFHSGPGRRRSLIRNSGAGGLGSRVDQEDVSIFLFYFLCLGSLGCKGGGVCLEEGRGNFFRGQNPDIMIKHATDCGYRFVATSPTSFCKGICPSPELELSAPKSQPFLRFAIAMPIADPRNRAISETRESNAALRFKSAMESR